MGGEQQVTVEMMCLGAISLMFIVSGFLMIGGAFNKGGIVRQVITDTPKLLELLTRPEEETLYERNRREEREKDELVVQAAERYEADKRKRGEGGE